MTKSISKKQKNETREWRETFKVKHLTEVRQKYLLSLSLLLLLLFSEPRLESHSNVSLSIPVTPGNSSLIWSHVTLGSGGVGGGGGGGEGGGGEGKKKIFRETRRGEKSPGERRGKEKMLHVIKGGGGREKVWRIKRRGGKHGEEEGVRHDGGRGREKARIWKTAEGREVRKRVRMKERKTKQSEEKRPSLSSFQSN